MFLSRLAAILSNGLRTLVVPPQPLFDIQYASRIIYHVYVIAGQNTYPILGDFAFSYEAFKAQVRRLTPEPQEVQFTMKQYVLSLCEEC